MTYSETIDYLFERLPMFQRIGAAAYKADLKNTLALCEILGHPESKFKSIHIAGTNGKGSTSHMLASILQSAGYKTGLYTSPHLKDFRERIKINGVMIPEDEVISFVERYKPAFEEIDLSFFEWTVGLCFDYFAKEKVDIAVIETGLGGRLDSTNVITPEVSLITNISYDHMNLLGNTLEKIAGEKAGIIKPGVPVVVSEDDETSHVFIQRAEEMKSAIYFPSGRSKVQNVKEDAGRMVLDIEMDDIRYNNLELDLTGNYQRKNVIGVLQTIGVLQKQGWEISEKHIYSGLKEVKHSTGLMGRWQRICVQPLTICDVGHNEAGIKEVVQQISKTPHQHLHFVLGMVNDKDISTVLKLLPADATYYFCKAAIPRAMDAMELKDKASTFHLNGQSYPSVMAALKAAQSSAGEEDLVFVGGSTFVVAEVV
ncbi:MAG: bifunctional folylpolyglutamate synthase/dihydrofolate synthase [Bacteroidetes bacterium]|nr:bifunctional folylpolyglutamate synthase/dihydrofolate synthase [Bacteroidota bacterium]